MVKIGLVALVLILSLIAVPLVWSDSPEGREIAAAAGSPEPEPSAPDDPLLQHLGVPWESLSPEQREALRGAIGRRMFGDLPQQAQPLELIRRAPSSQICLAGAAPSAPAGAAVTDLDLCEVGRQLSRSQPCGSPKDCMAYLLWTSRLGEPGLRAAQPRAESPTTIQKASEKLPPAGDRR